MLDKSKKESIILIGMPGCGKSTVGVLLAKALCMQFLDTDIMIQRREKKPLQRIIAEKGNDYFSRAERRALMSLCPRGQVIATGGSVIFYPRAMEHLKTLGKVIFLDVPFEELERRIWNLESRGIVFKPGQDLRGLFEEREPLYKKYADFSVSSVPGPAERVVARIKETLKL